MSIARSTRSAISETRAVVRGDMPRHLGPEMPPQTPKSIATYFTKLPAPKSPTNPKAAVRSVVTTSSSDGATATSSTTAVETKGDKVTTIAASTEAGPSSSPLTVLASSPAAAGTGENSKKRFLSDAARQAIKDAVGEESDGSPAAKKTKTANGSAAHIFRKPLVSPMKPLSLPLSTSREELRRNLEGKGKASLLDMELDTLGEDWLLALQEEFAKPYFATLKEFVTKEQNSKKVFPPAADVYSWSRLCPLQDIRVVIVGQDPYHDDGQAHGLAFSVRKGMRIPPSLRNIYKEMGEEIPGFIIPKHGDLTEWAKHGVLLLNTSLTVRAHEAASHSNKGWETFTAAVLRVVTSRLSPSGGGNGVCFMAWGAHAQKMCAGVDTKKHLVLKSVHPSPLAAARGFFGCGHFKKANAWLEERYGPGGGIDWAALGATP